MFILPILDSVKSMLSKKKQLFMTFDMLSVSKWKSGINWFKLYEQEKIENQKAEYAEKMKNKIAMIHKAAEEKRALVEAKRGEELLKAEETAAKYRATGQAPKKGFSCFSA